MSERRFKVQIPKLPVVGWPGMLAKVSQIIGDDLTREFAEIFGDTRLHMPTTRSLSRKPEHPLIKAIGTDAAMKLAKQLGGIDYQVPTGRHAINFNNIRNFRVRGWKVRDIAKALRFREETVKGICEDVVPAVDHAIPVKTRCHCCGTMKTYTPPEHDNDQPKSNRWWAGKNKRTTTASDET